jgi:hypothetical protein
MTSFDLLPEEVDALLGSVTKEGPLADYVAAKADAEFTLEGEISKLDDERRLVFGWASIAEIGGKIVTDLQGDRITEDTLEQAAYDYVLNARVGGRMHEDDDEGEARQIGTLVESIVFTKEKQKSMVKSLRVQGIEAELDLGCIAWWIGFRVQDDTVWQEVKDGKLKAFSVGGRGKREKMED